MIQVRPLSLVFLVAAACTAGDAEELSIDLSEHGIVKVTAEGDAVTMFDADRQAVGTVVATAGGIEISLRGTSAALSWDDATGWVSCGDSTAAIARASAGIWELEHGDATVPPATACATAMEVGRRVADVIGIRPPWHGEELSHHTEAVQGWSEQGFEIEQACTNVSSYVYMAGCDACFSHACYAAFGSGQSHRCNQSGTSSCSAGMFWTSCSITYCN